MRNFILKRNFAIMLMSIVLCSGIQAQVVIGMDEKPAGGALLDLKEKTANPVNNSTSNKGLLLPRVELTNLNKLYPMFPDGSTYDPAENAKHTGLVVYNVGNCPGIYVWTGVKWLKLDDPCIPSPNQPTGASSYAFCEGSSVTLTASVNAGETVDWYNASGTLIATGTTLYTVYSAGTYYAEARNTSTGAVSATRLAVTVTMNPKPTLSSFYGNTNPTQGASNNITYYYSGASSVVFYVDGTQVASGTTSVIYNTNGLSQGSHNYTVTATSAAGCQSSTGGTITVNPSGGGGGTTLGCSDPNKIINVNSSSMPTETGPITISGCARTLSISNVSNVTGTSHYEVWIDGALYQTNDGITPTMRHVVGSISPGETVNVKFQNSTVNFQVQLEK